MHHLDPSVAGVLLGLLIVIGLAVTFADPLEALEHKLAEVTHGTTDLVRNADGILVPADRAQATR